MLRHALILTCCLAPVGGVAQTPPDVPSTPTGEAAEQAAEPRPADEPMTLRRELGLAIAMAYGFSHWDRVEEISFTFNVKRPNSDEPMSRSWTWNPKSHQVTRTRNGETITFTTGRLRSEAETEADKQFINDSYWLLFPFQIVWSNPELTDHGQQPLPIRPQESGAYQATPRDDGAMARKVTVQYPNEGGYTPGDAYDLYLDDELRIVQWVFRRGGGEMGRPMTWEGNRQLGPIIVSTEHWGPGEGDDRFRLWFSDLSVKVRADDGEIAEHGPEPLREAP